MRNGIIFALIALVVVCFASSAIALQRASEQADRNTEAIVFVCKTTTALAVLVQASIESIEASFENGTYARLVRDGVLTEDDVSRTADQLQTFREQKVLLDQRTSRCTI